jgi:S1-C subfamily serine protease
MLNNYLTPELAKWRAAELQAEADHERLVRQSRRGEADAPSRRSVRAVWRASRARRGRLLIRLGGAAMLVLFLFAVIPNIAPAEAAEPTGTSRAVTLGEPGVVLVKTSVAVSVRLTLPDSSKVSGVAAVDGTYHSDYGTGSGFVVSPDGAIVTASHVVEPAQQDVRNFAANQLFFTDLRDRLGYNIDGEDPWVRYTIPDDGLDGLLQQCYEGVACSFTIEPTVEVFTPVQLAGAQLPRGLAARILTSTGVTAPDVAVLRVDGRAMPTVPLANTATGLQSGDDLVALGFAGSAQDLPTGVTEPTKAFGKVSNVRTVGASRQIQADLRAEGGMSGGPILDAHGQVVGLESYTLPDDRGEPTQEYLRSVDDVRAALKQAGVQPARGQTDELFARAMQLFWHHHYSASLPLLEKVVNLHDGHLLAKRYLSDAQSRAGTNQDLPLARGRTTAALTILTALLLVTGLAWTRRRRMRRTGLLAPLAALCLCIILAAGCSGTNDRPVERDPMQDTPTAHDRSAPPPMSASDLSQVSNPAPPAPPTTAEHPGQRGGQR